MEETKRIVLLMCFLHFFGASAQDTPIKWWNPEQHKTETIEGKAWPNEVETFYDRLPHKAKPKVREAVWRLSKHAAGLKIRFRSNSENITVRYTVGSNLAMHHMPTTGVSGVDLYAINSSGKLLWCNGQRTIGDTISFKFKGLRPNDEYHKMGREYRLNLPLYNSVKWLEIGTDEGSYFEPLPVRKEKPIVVYGTSIAQGACASRPGMAWTNILSRNMDRPLINLAFSGNGRLEKELVDLLAEIEAKIYILDCLPNLTNTEKYNDTILESKVLNSVRLLKQKHPDTPILLVDHAGYADSNLRPERKKQYTRTNTIQKAAYKKLKKKV